MGAGALRKWAEDWFVSFRGPITCNVRDLKVAAGRDVAFCHSLNRFRGTKTGGDNIDMWVRSTVGFRKIDGKWVVVHDHGSVPFDPETGKASLDLQP